MVRSQRDYLTAMGITVWQVRRPDSVAVQAETLELDSVLAPVPGLPSSAQASTSQGGASTNRLALVKQQLTGLEPIKQKQAERPVKAEHEAADTGPKPDTSKTSYSEFLMLFLDYDACCFVVSLSYDAATLPAIQKRFLDDVYFAMYQDKLVPRIQELRWPLVRAAHIQPGEAETRQAVKINIPDTAKRFVLFGELAAHYLKASDAQATASQDKKLQADSSSSNGVLVQDKGRQFLLVDDIQSYFDQPANRSTLWRQLQKLVALTRSGQHR